MAKAGDELLNPVTGLRTMFRKTAEETSGELLQVDWIGEPSWTTGPDHVHPRQEERFEVLSGRLGLRADGIERVHGVGDVIVVSAGSPHAACNAGDDEVHVLVDFRPALRTERAFETLAGLAREGKTNRAGPPRTRCGWRSSCGSSRRRSTSSAPSGGSEGDPRGAGLYRGLLGYRAVYPYPYARQSEAYRIVM
jgi:quercetin dioxygenase-like cupin family protein